MKIVLLNDEVKCKRIYFHNIVQYLSTSNFMIYTLSQYKNSMNLFFFSFFYFFNLYIK